MEYLPELIGNLYKLQELDVEDNQLDSLPDSIDNLKNLKNLFIANNNGLKRPSSLALDFCDVR